jgi:anti-sigma regulatory factor (Ser/Thr protein kinase)
VDKPPRLSNSHFRRARTPFHGHSGGSAPLKGATLGETWVAEIKNDMAEIARVTSRIEEFGKRQQLPKEFVFQFVLAFDELLTNIISYGFLDGGSHKITASMAFEGDRLEAEIVDDGIAFNPLARPTPDLDASVEERKVGGLGIHFVRTVMDSVHYRRQDGHNHLKMMKKVSAEPANEEAVRG